jgi:predicted porin
VNKRSFDRFDFRDAILPQTDGLTMKKTLLASVLVSCASATMAQSSVTIFGVVDTTLQQASQNGVRATRLLGIGGNQFSRLGFRGTEDLGGGLSAGFTLDMGFNADSGAGFATSADNQTAPASLAGGQGFTFNRRSTVSLMGPWGELRVGRDFVPTYWNLTVFDPFGTAGAGSVNNLAQSALTRVATVQTAVRASNSIGYFLPAGLGGVYGQAMHALGENASNAAGGTSADGNYSALRLGYASGALNAALSYGQTSLASGDVKTSNIGASYDLGAAKVMGQYFRDSKEIVAAPNHSHGWLVGAQISMGAGYFPISYATVKDNSATARTASQFALGYVHNLSKRTALYATLSRLQNKNGAALTGGGVPGAANEAWRALDLGIRHTF